MKRIKRTLKKWFPWTKKEWLIRLALTIAVLAVFHFENTDFLSNNVTIPLRLAFIIIIWLI